MASAPTEAPDTEQPKPGISPVGEFATKCQKLLSGFAPGQDEKIADIIITLAQKYALEGPQAAEEEFKQHYNVFSAVADAQEAMAQIKKGQHAKGLARLGQHVGSMNLVQAELIGGLTQNIPVIGFIGTALKKLAEIEKLYIGVTGKQGEVFKTIGKFMVTVDGKVQNSGILDELKTRIGGVMASDSVAGVVEKLKGVVGGHGHTQTLQAPVLPKPPAKKTSLPPH